MANKGDEGSDDVRRLPTEKVELFSKILLQFNFRELLMIIGDVSLAASLFIPWIDAFSPPSGPDLKIILVASPNLFDLVLHSDYGSLVLMPMALVFGVLFLAPKMRKRRGVRMAIITGALVLAFLGNFAFGIQYGGAIGLVMDGQYVSYSISLGPGTRVAELSSAMYFLTLLAMVFSDD